MTSVHRAVFVNHVYLFDGHIKRVVFPCNLSRTHWYACVMDFTSKVVYIHDPFGGAPEDYASLTLDIRHFLQVHARACVEEFHRAQVEEIIESINHWEFEVADVHVPRQVCANLNLLQPSLIPSSVCRWTP